MKGRRETKFPPALATVSASKNNYESNIILINQKVSYTHLVRKLFQTVE